MPPARIKECRSKANDDRNATKMCRHTYHRGMIQSEISPRVLRTPPAQTNHPFACCEAFAKSICNPENALFNNNSLPADEQVPMRTVIASFFTTTDIKICVAVELTIHLEVLNEFPKKSGDRRFPLSLS
jgi:hypothetical protein